MKRTNQYTEEALKAIARIAIIDSRRSRFIEFASTSKGIEKWLKDLDHFENYINMRKAISFQDSRQVFGFNRLPISYALQVLPCVVPDAGQRWS